MITKTSTAALAYFSFTPLNIILTCIIHPDSQ